MAVIGRGHDVALWFNARAKQVTPAVVEAFRRGLPGARLYATHSLKEARVAAAELVASPPALVLVGGGDGTAVVLLNLLRAAGATRLPVLGFLRLGTGNGWPRATGAPAWRRSLAALPHAPLHPPTHRFNLVEVEGRLCHFAGVGWDASVLHDYRRNLRRRERQPVAAELATRVSKTMLGYLYTIARRTVPREVGTALLRGRPRVTLENLGEPTLTLDKRHHPVPVPGNPRTLFHGRLSVGVAGTEPYWGGGFKAFPYAQAVPGRVNLRIYDRPALEGFALTVPLWQGRRVPGMHDWYVTRARMSFSRAIPFQVGGDVVGYRKSVEFAVSDLVVDAVDWARLLPRGQR